LGTAERGDTDDMGDREEGTYSTPPEAAPPPEVTREAKRDIGRTLPVLFGSIFIAFVVVALIVLLAR
jgi:hypothetical protein